MKDASTLDRLEADAIGLALGSFVRRRLPELNERVRQGEPPSLLTSELALDLSSSLGIDTLRALDDAIVVESAVCSRTAARRILGALGYVLSSLEAFLQARSAAPGEGVRASGLERALLAVAVPAGLPPYANVNTMWLDNPPRGDLLSPQGPLTFTRDGGETWFGDAVRVTDTTHRATIDLLRPVVDRTTPFTSPEACDAMAAAAANMAAIKAVYRSFTDAADPADWPMSPAFFARDYRPMLAAYPVGVRRGAGANAFYLASQATIDFMLGTTNPEHRSLVASWIEHVALEDAAELREALASTTSLTSLAMEALGIGERELRSSSAPELAARVRAHPERVRVALRAYGALVRGWSALSATHWGLIANYLLKPGSASPVEPSGVPARAASTGVSGAPLSLTRQLFEMRRTHPLASPIARAVGATASVTTVSSSRYGGEQKQ